jgi:hypothetical protein
MRLFVFVTGFFLSSIATGHEALHGLWGTEAQCARTLITPQGTKRASPFDIRADWLGHGDVWCRLLWSSVVATDSGTVAMAKGLCGEDAVRDYQIRFNLAGDALTIIWNMQHNNGPLRRCVQ